MANQSGSLFSLKEFEVASLHENCTTSKVGRLSYLLLVRVGLVAGLSRVHFFEPNVEG